MSSCKSVVCCKHGAPCLVGNFDTTFFDGGPELEAGVQLEGPQTCTTLSLPRGTNSSRSFSVSSINENFEDSAMSSNSSCNRTASYDGDRFGQAGSPGHAAKVYIGIKSTDEAERIVTRPTDFQIYHRLREGHDINSLHPQLALYIVYRSTKNVARHIPIKTVVENNRHFLSAGTSGGDKPLLFASLDALVKYYKTYVELQPQDSTGMVDVFSA